jgi:predicted DNA-binding transcriptional regulator AlpA
MAFGRTIRERIELAKQQELLTVEQVALLSQYDPQTIYRKVWAHQIPGVLRLGRGIRFRREAILPWATRAQQLRSAAHAL